MADKRHSVAVYAIVRTQRDALALTLMHIFCFDCGWVATDYVDKGFPRVNDAGSAWNRMIDDISRGGYYAVVMAGQAEGMAEYCEYYGTHLAEIDPFAIAGSSPLGKSVRVI